jgi:SAM-dependent methyltransferase
MGSWAASLEGFTDPCGARRVAQFAELLSRFPTGRLVDLGSGHGIFARVAADLGWQVTAIDARDERFPDDPRITWVKDDVRNFADAGEFDVVACLGLWYHLTLEDQRELAARCVPRPLILDTHVAMPDTGAHQAHGGRIGPPVVEQGYAGRFYSETGMLTRATASVHNSRSFWPTADELERILIEQGYDVLERVGPRVTDDRWFFLVRSVPAHQQRELRELARRYVSEGVQPADSPGPRAPSGTGLRAVAARARRLTRTR